MLGIRSTEKGARDTRHLILRLAVLAGALLSVGPSVYVLRAQAADTMAFYKALDLEAAGKYKDAVPLFKVALRTSAGVNALLGLERAYAELGWGDSLIVPLDSLIAASPKEEMYRTVQLRTLESLGRDAQLRA